MLLAISKRSTDAFLRFIIVDYAWHIVPVAGKSHLFHDGASNNDISEHLLCLNDMGSIPVVIIRSRGLRIFHEGE